MTGLLFALVFSSGIALVWFGAVVGVTIPSRGMQRTRAVVGLRRLAVGALAATVAGLAVYEVVGVPILALGAAAAVLWAPAVWRRRARETAHAERERAWPAALAQLADGLEAGLAFPAAVALVSQAGPPALRSELAGFHARVRTGGLEAALDGLATAGERSADTVALLLRTGLMELPTGGLAPVLRELSTVLEERFEARATARSRAASLQVEAAILAVSPILLLLLVGLVSPAYLDAYRTAQGTLVAAVGAVLIFGCYLLMRYLGRVPEPRRTQHRRAGAGEP